MHVIYGAIFYLFLTIFLCSLDKLLNRYSKGNYYLLHGVSNMLITYTCYNDVINTYTNFHNFNNYNVNYIPSMITVSLHSYHIVNYYDKLLFDDWLHHILMCGVALPIGVSINSGYLLNHSLFFLTGLPGGINYFNLFLTRNNCMKRLTQKKINKWLNLWIRVPGCVSHSVLSLVIYYNYKQNFTSIEQYLILCTIILTFWNGIYFMEQVVTNYALENYKKNWMLKDKKSISS